jgi:SP family facilitated glucose transporter-like MFS transporter 1
VWVSYFSIFLVIFFVVLFASGVGSIPWFLVSELFSQGARPIATSIAVAVNWSANFIVGLSFLPLLVSKLWHNGQQSAYGLIAISCKYL